MQIHHIYTLRFRHHNTFSCNIYIFIPPFPARCLFFNYLHIFSNLQQVVLLSDDFEVEEGGGEAAEGEAGPEHEADAEQGEREDGGQAE